jgi:hypothetical protein
MQPTVTNIAGATIDFIDNFNSLSIPASIKLQFNFHNLKNFCFTHIPKTNSSYTTSNPQFLHANCNQRSAAPPVNDPTFTAETPPPFPLPG